MAIIIHNIILIQCLTLTLQYGGYDAKEKFYDRHYHAEKQRTDSKSVPFERVTQLYSKASKGHVQIVGRRVDALGKAGSPYGKSLFVLL